ncbi:MAG: N-6 DNA methylase [Phycisphaerales bacterium]|nr:N-6 DNA methylase [Phycisphaerales bacterium]
MASKRDAAPGNPALFVQQFVAARREARRQRALFIPRFVSEAGRDPALIGTERERARKILLHWAELEWEGRLAEHRETSIDTQFLDAVFSDALGYALLTRSPESWQLSHKHPVPGVGIADAALGHFPSARSPSVVIELKDANTDLDRDRRNGRSAVQQCWDYLNALPECEWGIVSNFSLIRLYHRTRGALAYEEFSLQELRGTERFNEFFALFERQGLLSTTPEQKPRARRLLERTLQRQKEVGNDLYDAYREQRLRLIDFLIRYERKPLDRAIAIAQKVLDRIIFIAFCEDRELLPSNCLERAYSLPAAFSRVKNPRWRNFIELFRAVDQGYPEEPQIHAYNGGLFADDAEIDAIELPDDPYTRDFRDFGNYDFSEEVNVEVLGHLFERSITELEKLRVGGLYALSGGEKGLERLPPRRTARRPVRPAAPPAAAPRMEKSAHRKRFGIYYTPPAFTGLIVERTVDALIRRHFESLAREHGVDPDARSETDPATLRRYWNACLDALQRVTICDPACGSGAFLIRAYESLDAHYKAVIHGLAGSGEEAERVAELEAQIAGDILGRNLHGVDLSREAVEITQLALWIRSAQGHTLANLSKNILHGNSLVSDPAVDPHALDWRSAFPHIFGEGAAGGFSCVIGNPPWERVKVQDREFFSMTDPQTAEAVSAADRKKRIAAMPRVNPPLHVAYEAARDRAQRMLDYARRSAEEGGRYPLTGRGDINLYMLFAELARSIVAPDGFAGLLVPSGIATDDTTKAYFNDLMDRKALISLYDFENKEGHFEDVHRSFKFTALVFGGSARCTEQADFVFFAHDVEEVSENNAQRHIPLTAADMKLLNPNTRTCPIFRTRRDAALTRAIYRRVPILIDENRRQGGNPWGIKFFTMFHQTNDAQHFGDAGVWEKKGYTLAGNVYTKGKKRALPLYEAKMVQAFDHRAASVVVEDENWVRQGQKEATTPVQHANPEFAVIPRWWVPQESVCSALSERSRDWFLAFKDVTSATNERTMIAAFLPCVAAVNSAPLMLPGENVTPRLEACLLGNMNAFAYDFVARQKVGAVHLNFFIVEQLPTLPPNTYADKCPWSRRETLEHWISERVLKLSCTAEDMIPLAQACNFKGSRGDGVHIWQERERAELRAELDAAFFILYGIERPDVEYILSTFTGTGFIPPDERGDDNRAFLGGRPGAEILDAYDRLSSAARGQ